ACFRVLLASALVASLTLRGLASCGDKGAGAAATAAACDPALTAGDFVVTLADTYTAISGTVAEHPRPASTETVDAKDGACQLSVRHGLFCDPPCNGGQLCTTGNRCVPEPRNLDVGVVSVSGLKEPVTLTAKTPT